jgi:hypothetical protein
MHPSKISGRKLQTSNMSLRLARSRLLTSPSSPSLAMIEKTGLLATTTEFFVFAPLPNGPLHYFEQTLFSARRSASAASPPATPAIMAHTTPSTPRLHPFLLPPALLPWPLPLLRHLPPRYLLPLHVMSPSKVARCTTAGPTVSAHIAPTRPSRASTSQRSPGRCHRFPHVQWEQNNCLRPPSSPR